MKWVPAEILPEAYGGTLKDPDGDPKCPSKVRRRFIEIERYCFFLESSKSIL